MEFKRKPSSSFIEKWRGFMVRVSLLWLVVFCFSSFAQEVKQNEDEFKKHKSEKKDRLSTQKKIDKIFQNFAEGKFDRVRMPVSGWVIRGPSGSFESRSVLQWQAKKFVIPQGEKAVPFLFKWVRYEQVSVRYIAVYSLEKITKVNPSIPNLGKSKDGSEEKAIAVWAQWIKDWENKEKFLADLKSEDTKTIMTAIAGLGRIGVKASFAVPALEKLLDDLETQVCQAARQSLSKITRNRKYLKEDCFKDIK